MLPFWDLAHLDDWENVELVQTTPEAVPAGTYTDPQFPEVPMIFPSVWRDAASAGCGQLDAILVAQPTSTTGTPDSSTDAANENHRIASTVKDPSLTMAI